MCRLFGRERERETWLENVCVCWKMREIGGKKGGREGRGREGKERGSERKGRYKPHPQVGERRISELSLRFAQEISEHKWKVGS